MLKLRISEEKEHGEYGADKECHFRRADMGYAFPLHAAYHLILIATPGKSAASSLFHFTDQKTEA